MSDFKWRHFQGGVILWAVRWYSRYGVSYRDLEQMMGERACLLIIPRSIAGFKSMRQKLKNGYAGIGVVRNRPVGVSMRPM